MAEFRMPSLGSDMKEGTLLEWRVKAGDHVRHGDIIAVVDTDKAAIEIEVFEDGIVEALIVQPGQKVPVGAVMAVIREEGMLMPPIAATSAAGVESRPAGAPPAGTAAAEAAARVAQAEREPPAAGIGPGRVRASPFARKVAVEKGVDLARLRGTGPDGAIRAADVERAAAGAETPGLAAEEPMPGAPTEERARVTDYASAMRRAIAAAMARSNREIPH
jgi:pyruvate dehydrogenase E2 component (dihydrolipoamide acetyltransferase)